MAENDKAQDDKVQVAGKVSPEANQTLRLLAILDGGNFGDYVAKVLEEHAADNPVEVTRSKSAPEVKTEEVKAEGKPDIKPDIKAVA